MKIEDLKKHFGDEYPVAATRDGIRMPLCREGRFSRHYQSYSPKIGTIVSRFMDESASITASELRQEWPAWTEEQRLDFCGNCSWLYKQSDYPEMLRYIMQHGGPDNWSGIANLIASQLPREEAFQFLLQALHSAEIGRSSNIVQGIALTKHPDAESTLRSHLQSLWKQRSLWDDDKFLNWVAQGAIHCIQYLIELGAPAADFEDQVRRLSQHVCAGNRESCVRWLSAHYPWLKGQKP
jgi:hypothetical protein